jgi:2-polyprenyl-3-methyl-5-hydroxy-6-metoxy-1,4-benzoquinol methylase
MDFLKKIKPLIYNKLIAKLLLKQLLRMHSFSYRFAGRFAGILNNNSHPKHKIINYEKWFLDNIENNWKILDIGCNIGQMSKTLAQKARFVYAIDIDPQYIEQAKKTSQAPNIEYICADAAQFDYTKNQPIDCVIMSNVLEHIEYRIEFLKKLTYAVNWNQPNNKTFLIRVPMLNRDWITIYKKQIGLEYRLDKTHHIEYTIETLTRELEQAGINIKESSVRFGEIYAICKAE